MVARPFPLAAALLVLPLMAQAGQPLATDDSDVKPARDCEWETSASRERQADGPRSRAWTSTLGCGVGLESEIAIGVGRAMNGPDASRLWSLGGKTSLRASSETAPGIALAWMVLADQAPGVPPKAHGVLVTGVVSRPVGAGATLHGNLGVSHDRSDSTTRLSWAVAAERSLNEAIDVTAEAFGVGSDAPWAAVGLRWNAHDRVTAGIAWSRDFSAARARSAALTVTLAF